MPYMCLVVPKKNMIIKFKIASILFPSEQKCWVARDKRTKKLYFLFNWIYIIVQKVQIFALNISKSLLFIGHRNLTNKTLCKCENQINKNGKLKSNNIKIRIEQEKLRLNASHCRWQYTKRAGKQFFFFFGAWNNMKLVTNESHETKVLPEMFVCTNIWLGLVTKTNRTRTDNANANECVNEPFFSRFEINRNI